MMDNVGRLNETVRAFCQYINSLQDTSESKSEWGAREVLAHLVFHHEHYVCQARERLAGKDPELLSGRFKDLNAEAVRLFRNVSIQELIDRFIRANRHLVDICRSPEAERLTIVIKAGAKPRTLRNLIPEAEAHIRNHLKKLAR